MLTVLLDNLGGVAVLAVLLVVILCRNKLLDMVKAVITESHTKVNAASMDMLRRLQHDVDEIIAHDARQDEKILDIQMTSLKKTVWKEGVPLPDKVAAFIRYHNNGGNSATQQYFYENVLPGNESLFEVLKKEVGWVEQRQNLPEQGST
jgi:hypothetical protein